MKLSKFFYIFFLIFPVLFSTWLKSTIYDGTIYNVYRFIPTILKNGDKAIGKVGFKGGVTVPVGTGARLNIDLPISTFLDLRLTGSLELTGNLILDSNISLSSGGTIGLGNHSLILNGNLQVPDNAVLEFASSGIVDGQGHDVILGKYAQLLVDGGVTVTFKNMTIKNMLSTISCPPIRCMDWYSQACFDNVVFAFNDDFAFRDGQFFIHNDVEFTGTSKFSYRSVRPSYITQHSNLIFDPNATFEYYPSTIDNSLVQMADKTSTIIFDGSTLLTTHTGVRLTKGNLYFDDKVTLSSADNNVFTDLTQLAIGFDFTNNARGVSWSPDGKYLAVGGNSLTTDLIVYSWNGLSLTIKTSKSFGTYVYGVDWSPDGKYLAVGGDYDYNDLVIYSWDGSSLTLTTSKYFGTYAITPNWSPDGKYLAVAGQYNQNGLIIYRWSGESLTLTTSKYFGTLAYSVNWSPDGKYLAVGGNYGSTDLIMYEWNGSTLTQKDSRAFSDRVYGVRWSPDGKYLAVGGADVSNELFIYGWNGSILTEKTAQGFGALARGIRWSPDGKYLAVGGNYDYNDLVIYSWDGSSLTVTTSKSFGTYAFTVDWRPDGKYLAVGGENGSRDVVVYGVGYKFETSPQGFSNSIIFGNSEIGSSQDLDVYALSAARVGIYGKVWQDSVTSGWNFQSRDSYVSLDRYDSEFKITSASSMEYWKKNQIIKSSAPNTLFLQDNQVWSTDMDQLAPEETFEFMDDLKIPDGQLTQFAVNAVIDGNGHDLILGKYAQLLVDGGVTVTFKNMTIKNTLNTISCPPIHCTDWYSKACFDNVSFAFNDDWAFRNGQFFIQNDVNFTGTSKLSYRSVRPSYITSHSNLIFDPQTTFEFYPSTNDNNLIKMQDKTSAIIFDGSTLQTTLTGIRLTKGSVYFDNKITLSSSDNTALASQITATLLNITAGSNRSYAAAWRPTGQYVAFGYAYNKFAVSDYRLSSNIYYDGTSNNPLALAWDPTGRYLVIALFGDFKILEFESDAYKSVVFHQSFGFVYIWDNDWSPDGEKIIWGDSDGNVRIAPFSNLQQNPATPSYIFNKDMGAEIRAVAWNPDGEHIAWGNSAGNLEIYKYSDILANPTSPTYTFSQDVGSAFSYQALQWSPDGQYLAWVDSSNYVSIITLSELNKNQTTPSYTFKQQITGSTCVAWSPNGAYLAVGSDISDGNLRIYSFESLKVNPVSPTPILIHNMGWLASFKYGIYVLDWSPDGNNIIVAGGNAANNYIISTFSLQYNFDTSTQGYSNGIIFGNSALGDACDADIYLLGGANVIAAGKVWYDDVN